MPGKMKSNSGDMALIVLIDLNDPRFAWADVIASHFTSKEFLKNH